MDSIELARTVFSAFKQAYDQHADREVWWSLNPFVRDEEDLDLGLSQQELGVGVRVLKQKDLIEAFTSEAYRLTELGEECCLHPELLDEYLAPRRGPSATAPSVTISGGHVQIGDGNTQNISYGAILQEALRAVEERDDVPAAVATSLRRLAEFPDIEVLLSEAAARASESK